MILGSVISAEVEATIDAAIRDLVRVQRVNGAYYVNLPLIYPDGSFVTVRLEEVADGVRISDAGFAYRQVDDLDAARSFRRTANKVAETTDVLVGERALYVDAPMEDLHRGIIDVATASWRVADHICQRVFDEDEDELADELNARLVRVFGTDKVSGGSTLIGASTNEWQVSAVVSVDGHSAVFQAVSDRAPSIYKTATAFHDLSRLPKPPRLVAVVRDKQALGKRLGLLDPGRIIEEDQPDDLYRRAAA